MIEHAPQKQKKVFYHIGCGLLFLVFLWAFDRGLFHLIRVMEKKMYQERQLTHIFHWRGDFNKRFPDIPKGTYSTLIMGSSRTFRGLHPYYFYKKLKQKAFKVANGDLRLRFHYYFYQHYKRLAGIPKVVVFGLDYFMFKLDSEPYYLKFVENTKEQDIKYKSGFSLLVSNKKHFEFYLGKLMEKMDRLLPVKKNPPPFSVVDSFIGYPKTVAFDTHRPTHFTQFKYFGYPGVEGLYFKKLLDDFKTDGVQVILIYIPDYIGTYESNYQTDAFKEDINQLTATYPNVVIYDYEDPRKFPLSNPDYFLDGGYGKTNSHLSRDGCRVFHRYLFKDIKKHYQ